MFDDALELAGDTLDTAADMLGMGEGDARGKTKAQPPPAFKRADPLTDPASSGTDTAPQNQNALDDSLIDFIHFGRIHQDQAAKFIHDELDDLKPERDLDADAVARGIMFRAALQRETLLLHEFVMSTHAVLSDYKSSQGGLGEIAGAAVDMISGGDPLESDPTGFLGDSKEADQPPDPAELKDMHIADICDAGGYANLDEIKWLDIHTAGRDLHLNRADYHQFCANCQKYYINKDVNAGSGALFGMLPDMGMVTGPIQMVQGIIFKAYDIYLAMYLLCRAEFEDDIEEAVYQMTMQGIDQQWRPMYPIWFPQPPEDDSGNNNNPPPPKSIGDAFVDSFSSGDPESEMKQTEEYQKAKAAVDEAKNFLGFEDAPDPTNGDQALNTIFAAFEGGASPGQAQPPSAAGKFVEAFEAALDIDGSIPQIIKDIIQELTAANIRLLKRAYIAVMKSRARVSIDVEVMKQAGREELADTMISLAGRFIPGLGFLNDPNSSLVNFNGLGNFGGQELSNMGSRYVDQGLGNQLAMIAEFSSAELATRLEEARNFDVVQPNPLQQRLEFLQGVEDPSDLILQVIDQLKQQLDQQRNPNRTMETLLGRLPWLLTLQFRNTFFPLVDLVMEEVFGALDGVLSQATTPVKGFYNNSMYAAKRTYNDAKGVYDDVADVNQKINNVQDNLSQPMTFTPATLISIINDPEKFANDLMSDPNAATTPDPDAPPPAFPGPGAQRKHVGPAVKPDYDDDYVPVQDQQKEMTIEK